MTFLILKDYNKYYIILYVFAHFFLKSAKRA
jgi:hypothetical protein